MPETDLGSGALEEKIPGIVSLEAIYIGYIGHFEGVPTTLLGGFTNHGY